MARPRNSADGQRMERGRGRGRGRGTATQGGDSGRAQAIQEGNPSQQRNCRRPLEDIGNIAGHIASGSNAPKNESVSGARPGSTHNATPAEGPVTREYDQTLASNQHVIQGQGEHEEIGNRQKRQRESQSRDPSDEVHESAELPELIQASGNTNEIMTPSQMALLREEKNEVNESAEPMEISPELIQVSGNSNPNEIMNPFQTTLLREENQSPARQDETLVPNIDEADANDPMCVREYVRAIYNFYREKETTSSVQGDYLSRQSEVGVWQRRVLVAWIIEIHQRLDLRPETLFLSVYIIDRYLSSQSVPQRKLQLVGATAMFLACKYEEVDIPPIDDFVAISESISANSEISRIEVPILTALEFNLSVPTPYVFMRRFLQVADSDDELEATAFFLIELALVEYEMVTYRPSKFAAAALYTARSTLRRHPSWNPTLEQETTYSEANLIESARLIVGFHENSNIYDQINVVYRKYMSLGFSQVANLAPALFIRDM